jgi:hypothetical protein
VAIGDYSSRTAATVHVETQDISQWQWATPVAGQMLLCMEIHKYITVATGDSNSWTIGRVYGDTQDISEWQLATPVAGQLVQCMEIHKLYRSGNWRLQ